MREAFDNVLEGARNAIVTSLVLIVLPFALLIEWLDPYDDEDEWG